MYAYSHNNTPLSQLKLSLYQFVFHTHPRIQIIFSLKYLRNSSEDYITTLCDSLSLHTPYGDQDLDLFTILFLNKPISS